MAKLITPRDIVRGHPVNESEYEALAIRTAQKLGRAVVEDARTLEAYVNHGMWVADCPHCNSGIVLHPEWSVAPCLGLGCHRVYRSIAVPAEWPEIEAVLSQRPMANQHWLASGARTRIERRGRLVLPAERVDDLVAENLARGLRSGLE